MKKITSILSTFTLLFILLITANFGDNNEAEWSLFDDSQYYVFSTSDNDKILTKILQDKDYLEIQEQLIDNTIKPLTTDELKKIKEDKNAYLTDNILPDGRYLKENWIELQNELIKAKTKSIIFGNSDKKSSEVSISIDKKANVIFEKVSKTEGDILVPISSDLQSFNYAISKNGKKTFIAGENGLYVIDPSTENVKELSKIDDGKYLELVDKSLKKYGMNTVFSNSAILPSDDGSKIIYLSNRNSFDENFNEIFLTNTEDGSSKILKTNKSGNYYPQNWIDDNNILFSIVDSDIPELTVINTDGDENNLGINGFVLSVKDNLIAYTDQLGGNTLHIIKFNKNKVEEIASFEVQGNIVSYPNFIGFSPDNNNFIVIYSPSNDTTHIYATLFNIKNKTFTSINNLPDDGDCIVDCTWIDNKSIMMTIGKWSINDSNMLTNTTWIYNIKEGR